MTDGRIRSHWAWGYQDEVPAAAQLRDTAAAIAGVIGFGTPGELEEPVPLDQVWLPAPRLSPPAELGGLCSQAVADRARLAHGQSYRDLIRAFRGQFDHVPDVVARPRGEQHIAALLAWCETVGAAVIPYGGGTSVTGGVEPDVGSGYSGTLCLDLTRMDRVLEVDDVSGAALAQAGVTGCRGHNHTPPRCRPRPPAVVRPAAAGAVRPGAARGKGRRGSARRAESGCAAPAAPAGGNRVITHKWPDYAGWISGCPARKRESVLIKRGPCYTELSKAAISARVRKGMAPGQGNYAFTK